jgi:hypothetical protein
MWVRKTPGYEISLISAKKPESNNLSLWRRLFVLQCFFVRNGQFFSAFSSAGSQHSAAIGARHSVAESVLIFSLSFGRLKGTFHDK